MQHQSATPVSPAAARPGKAERRRRELAEAALTTLARGGYARTGLREIAAASDFSHGVLHYYFRDKSELIGEVLRVYMAVCTVDHDADVAAATDADDYARLAADSLATIIERDAAVHRLWYDLRNQAVFEDGFRDEVAELDVVLRDRISALVAGYAKLTGTTPVLDEQATYLVVDGLFHGALEAHLRGEEGATDALRTAIRALLPRLVVS